MRRHPTGFLTIELLIATAVFALVMTGVFLVASGGQTMALDVGLSGGGVGGAFSSIQETTGSSLNRAGFVSLSDEDPPEGADGYDRSQTVGSVSPCMKALLHETVWGSEYNRTLSVSLATFIPSIEIAKEMGGGCDPFPASEWDNPDSLGSADIGGSDGTGVAVRSIGGNRIAVLSAAPSAAGKEDLYVYEVNTPASPTEEAKINLGKGLNGIAMAGTIAFVLENDNANQLKVVDVSTPSAPALIAQMTLPNISFACSPPASPCLAGRSIAYYGGYLYVGTGYLAFGASGFNHELHIYDVSTPSLPVWKGSVNVNHNVNDIVVDGSYAYLATSDDVGELTIVDVSDPSSPNVTGKYNAPWSTKDGRSVALKGSIVYLGRERAASGDYDLLSINAADPSNPSLLGNRRLLLNGASAVVTGIAIHGTYAFVGTSDTNDEFRVFDISVPAALTPYGCPPYNYSAKVRKVVYAEGYVFSVNESNDALRIIYDDPGTSCN